jgi:hypothetical protein
MSNAKRCDRRRDCDGYNGADNFCTQNDLLKEKGREFLPGLFLLTVVDVGDLGFSCGPSRIDQKF